MSKVGSTISSDEVPDAPVSWQVGTTVAALLERVDTLPVDDAAQKAPRNRTAQEQRGSGPRDRDQRLVAFQVCGLESSGCAYLWNDG